MSYDNYLTQLMSKIFRNEKANLHVLIHNHCEWIIIFRFFEMLNTKHSFSKSLVKHSNKIHIVICNMSNGFIGGCTLLCLSFNVGTWFSFYGFGKNRPRTSASSASCREMPVVAISRISAILVRIFSIRLPATSAPTLNK